MIQSLGNSRSFALVACVTLLTLSGCAGSLERVRPQALEPTDSDLSSVSDDLGILVVHIDQVYYALDDVLVTNLDTGERYSLPFFSNLILKSKALDYDVVGVNEDTMRHYVFLDLPGGRYQVNRVKIRIEGSGGASYDFGDLSGLFFEFEPGSPAYLGELLVSLGDPSNPRARRPTRTVAFLGSHNRDVFLPEIQSRYPALKNVEIQDGRVWQE